MHMPSDLEHYLHEHIPLSKAMAVSVVAVEQGSVVLGAPLAPWTTSSLSWAPSPRLHRAFTARSALQDPERWQQFTRMLVRKGKARVAVGSMLEAAGTVAGRFTGEFVALRVP
ncbi:YiiD C-terminal domain-containing protein [Ramlibacter sp.]|uniref:YiiD C-terminal domain-containing protein n=1 Tax=Ramlibacter sp. TaxID=1917967 RepID=UPI0018157E74|nr:YiiD C-terminal domain-containing protein [Ramlibacter sp.]MBA2676592.1 YiiD C-terminal domain-containing protein [Ramlibacter sp.]